MPRILVADDNSNIQKMVALALKDVGIDVVAVPNGEAAVRKLTDPGLDLVLADIFMPVRSGYEVCDYIKHDTRYSHLPVILLVGAFDPLDEREAQRVGADGILKKPFVPPDPLINMVKNLLAKSASDRLVAVAAPVVVAAVPVAPAAEPVPALPSPRFAKASLPDFPTTDFADAPPDEFVPPVGRLDFSEHEKPVAFSSLLDTPAVDEGDLTVTASRDPVLGEPAFWASPIAPDAGSEDDGTPAEEAIQEHSWAHHAQPLPFGTEGAALPPVKHQAELPSLSAETESGIAFGISPEVIDKISANTNGNGTEGGHLAGLEAALELPAFEAPDEAKAGHVDERHSEPDNAGRDNVLETSSVAAIEPTETAQLPSLSEIFAAPASPVDESFGLSKIFELPKTDELAAREIEAQPLTETTIETKPETKVETETEAAIEPEIDDTQELEIPESGVHPWNLEPVDPEAVVADSIAAQEVAHPAPRPSIDEMPAWMATASTIFPPAEDSPERSATPGAASPSEAEPAAHEAFEYSPRGGSEEPSVNDAQLADAAPTTEWPPAFEPKVSDAALFERPAVVTSAQMSDLSGALDPIATSAVEGAQLPGSAKHSPEVMEAAINRIVERMQPQVMDVVTREILRPLVEALVRRELGKQ